jgi:DNA-binding XRE family transcriptional regulator
VPFKEATVRPAEFSRDRYSQEWLKAMQGIQNEPPSERTGPLRRTAPAPDENLREYDHSLELQALIDQLKGERKARGLSLGDVARMTELARSALSRLENGRYRNPTLHTLYRYARALGWDIKFAPQPLADLGSPDDTAEPHDQG